MSLGPGMPSTKHTQAMAACMTGIQLNDHQASEVLSVLGFNFERTAAVVHRTESTSTGFVSAFSGICSTSED